MKTYSWIAATLGGYATATVLRYALVQAWLPRYVAGTPEANASRVTISMVVGAVLLVASAALTARWSGARNRAGAAGAGALAGLLAGGLAFGMFGAPAAGVAGAQPVYPFTVEPAQTDAIAELIDAVLGCIAWTYGMGWALLLGGGVIGALVGVVVGAGPADEGERQQSSFAMWLIVLVLSVICCTGLVVNVAIYSLLAQTISDRSAEINYAPSVPPVFVWYTTVGSTMIVVIVVLLLAWLWGRRQRPVTSAEARHAALSSYAIGVVAILAIVLVLIMNVRALLSATGVGLVVVVALGVLLIVLGRQHWLASRQGEPGAMALPGPLSLIGPGLAGGTVLASLVPFLGTALPRNLTLMVIPVIPYMVATGGPPPEVLVSTASELALINYTVQVRQFIRVWAASCAALVLVMLLARGLAWLWGRRRAQEPATE